ncbi:hypothetical protein, partial [Dialister hominis]|uniref:hypothetical protein n=1 Tax=Dialister hominis TaxID=2582419 RepID=UPI0032BFBCCC
MAYNKDFPADDSYLADFPANEREQIRAIVEDKIVNAGKVNGLTTSNGSGQVPVSNGTVNTNLNADMLDGHHAEYFSPSGHRHTNVSTSSDGFMSAADKTKLDGVSTGAEVNQNAFGNVAVGSTTLQADNKQDTLYINAGNNISIAADAANDKLTIGLSGIVPVANGGTGQSDLNKVNVGGAGVLNSWQYRPTTANNTFADAKVRYYLATPSMTTGKPPQEGYILHLSWDSGSWDTQLFLGADTGAVYVRAQNNSDDWSESTGWKALAFEADVPKNNGTGATGTWPVSVSGNAGTATKLATQRTISVSGTGLTAVGKAFDGTENITIPITLADALLAIAGVTPSAGKIPVFTGANTASLASITDFMKTLLGKASAHDVRSAIGAVDVSGAGVVAGNVSNSNAWWVKLGGVIPLIIQGGYSSAGSFTYPIALSTVLGIWI